MEFINTAIQQYAEDHSTAERTILKKITRDTHAQVLMPRMLSGHLQGRFLSMISHMIRPRTILEIGTYTGYSAICLAEGLQPGGTLYTLDVNEELEDRVRHYFEEAGLGDSIRYIIGDARTTLATLNARFDLVFIDADKENYSLYFDSVIKDVNLGGYILADNVLWSGKVLDQKADKDTRAIKEFNEKVLHDARVEVVMLPLRDGITVMRKIRE